MKTILKSSQVLIPEPPDDNFDKYYLFEKAAQNLNQIKDYKDILFRNISISSELETLNSELGDILTSNTNSHSLNGMPFFFDPYYDLKFIDHSISLQKWEGVVKNILKDSFIADLNGIPLFKYNNTVDVNEQAEIYKSEIDDNDLELLKIGSIFYWNIGYLNSPSGRKRFSEIRFKRLPEWTEQDIRLAKSRAKEFETSIKWK